MILCDTDIFIEAFKNNTLATGSLRRIGFQNISLSAIALMELYFGALNKRELAKIKSRLQKLEIINPDQKITYNVKDFKFVEGIRLYSEKI